MCSCGVDALGDCEAKVHECVCVTLAPCLGAKHVCVCRMRGSETGRGEAHACACGRAPGHAEGKKRTNACAIRAPPASPSRHAARRISTGVYTTDQP